LAYNASELKHKMNFFKKLFGFGKTVDEAKVSAASVPPSTIQIGTSKPVVTEKVAIKPVLTKAEPIIADIVASQPLVNEIAAVAPMGADVTVEEPSGAEFGGGELIAKEPMVLPIPAEKSPVFSESVFKNFDQVIHYPSAFDLRRKRNKLKIKKDKKTAPKSKFRKIPG